MREAQTAQFDPACSLCANSMNVKSRTASVEWPQMFIWSIIKIATLDNNIPSRYALRPEGEEEWVYDGVKTSLTSELITALISPGILTVVFRPGTKTKRSGELTFDLSRCEVCS